MKRHQLKPYSNSFLLWLGAVIALVVAILSAVDLERWIVTVVSINIATFLLFGYDKWKSARRGNRVPENILYLVTLLGGTAGALIGMHSFRHKTRKSSFQIVVALILLMQVGVAFWIL